MRFLTEGEKIYARFRTSRKYPPVFRFFLVGFLLLVLAAFFLFNIIDLFITLPEIPRKDFLFIPFLGIGILSIFIGEIKRKKVVTYYITNYRIVVDKGVLGTEMESVSYSMIVNIKIIQSFMEKLFGLGNLEISTARGAQEVDMKGVPKPKKVENIIYRMLEGHTGAERAPQKQQYQKPQYKKPQYRREQQRPPQRPQYRRR